MGDKKEMRHAEQNHDRTWEALGKTFRRQGQAEKFIRQNGYQVGMAIRAMRGGWV